MKYYKSEVSNTYLFKYAQSLKGNGNYTLADEYIGAFKERNPDVNITANSDGNLNNISLYSSRKEKIFIYII